MKGPFERLKYDLQRVWECPACHGRARSSGATTTLVCACQAKLPAREVVSMKLVADGTRLADVGPVAESESSTAASADSPQAATPGHASPEAAAFDDLAESGLPDGKTPDAAGSAGDVN